MCVCALAPLKTSFLAYAKGVGSEVKPECTSFPPGRGIKPRLQEDFSKQVAPVSTFRLSCALLLEA